MRVTVQYAYPEKGTRNDRIYPLEVLEKAFNKPAFKECCTANAVPLKDGAGELIGMGTAYLNDGRVVTIDAEVFSPPHIKAIKAVEHSFGFTLAGYGTTEYKPGIEVVTDFTIDSVLLCAHPAVDCFIELQSED